MSNTEEISKNSKIKIQKKPVNLILITDHL